LWVSDFTYVPTWQGWLYVAFDIPPAEAEANDYRQLACQATTVAG